uniref:class II histocompatibility antigen, M beta 1 chain n=1 Tax=Euleptes europaea TaxID=460621 RepID=UPI0025423F60|nr:class II histocompatibility antigen, M beta 1 chain [Euleptes europaea]
MPLLCYDQDFQGFVPCGLAGFPDWTQASYALARWFNQQRSAWGHALPHTCRQQMGPLLWPPTGDRRTPPNVRIFPISPWNTPAPVMLACDVWGFYPPEVGVTWLQNGAFVKNSSGIPVVSNGDWTYQTRLSLPVHPQSGDVYTCLVEHASLQKPLAKDWEPGLTPELKVKVGVSSAVLGVGILFLIAGIVCWSKRAPEGYAPIDGDNYPPGPSFASVWTVLPLPTKQSKTDKLPLTPAKLTQEILLPSLSHVKPWHISPPQSFICKMGI